MNIVCELSIDAITISIPENNFAEKTSKFNFQVVLNRQNVHIIKYYTSFNVWRDTVQCWGFIIHIYYVFQIGDSEVVATLAILI